MSYCTAAEVYQATSLSSTEIAEAAVNSFIQAAEIELDRETFTTYWALEDSGTATSGGNTTIADTSQTWTVDIYDGNYVWIYSGTGSGQVREIASNTSDTITVTSAWDTNPDNTSLYRVIYTATPPYYDSSEELIDGSGIETLYVPEYPIQVLQTVAINGTSVTPSTIYNYKKEGRLVLSQDSEKSTWQFTKPQQVEVDYWWGVYPIDPLAKRFVILVASLKTLAAQMGGTFNVPSTYSLPEGSVTIGQAYVNIRGTFDVMMKEFADLKSRLIRYPRIV